MLRESFTTAMKEAMRAGDKPRLAAIRLILAALKDRDIEARGQGRERATDDEIFATLQKMVKQRQESLAIYDKAGREDLDATERAEIAVIQEFLPGQLSEAETQAAVREAIAEVGAASMRDMGKVVALLRARYPGRMDFTRANAIAKGLIGG